jgi:hypothetical protein
MPTKNCSDPPILEDDFLKNKINNSPPSLSPKEKNDEPEDTPKDNEIDTLNNI